MLAAALGSAIRNASIWEMDDWIFRDAPDIDADVYLPADLYRRNAKGHRGLSVQRRDGARIAVDAGAIDALA